jgi:hypothetical protein
VAKSFWQIFPIAATGGISGAAAGAGHDGLVHARAGHEELLQHPGAVNS